MTTKPDEDATPDLIIYGGAFDPPHQGHIDCVAAALKFFPAAQLLITPGFQPAGAEGAHKTPMAGFADRMILAEAAFINEATEAQIEISDIESTLPSPNYTYKTVEALGRARPDRRMAIMMGLDQFKVFHRWSKPREMMALCDLIVVRRDTKESIVNAAQLVADSLEVDLTWRQDHKVAQLSNEAGSRFYIIDTKTAKAASSEIKFRLLKGKSLPEGWLTKPIEAAIESRRLYREEPKT